MGLFDDLVGAINDVKALGGELTEGFVNLKDEVVQPVSDVTEQLSGAVDSFGETANQVTDAKDAVIDTVDKLSGK